MSCSEGLAWEEIDGLAVVITPDSLHSSEFEMIIRLPALPWGFLAA